jgi:hypothetical protein
MSPRSVLSNFWGSFYFDLLLDLSLPSRRSWGRVVVFTLVLGLSAP